MLTVAIFLLDFGSYFLVNMICLSYNRALAWTLSFCYALVAMAVVIIWL